MTLEALFILLLIIFFIVINIKLKLNDMANSIAELSAKVDELQVALDAEQEQIKAAIQKLQDTIDELNAGNGTEEERQAMQSRKNRLTKNLAGYNDSTILHTNSYGSVHYRLFCLFVYAWEN